jgi:hypothetical protein
LNLFLAILIDSFLSDSEDIDEDEVARALRAKK